jgi:hypothetical protein
VLQDLRDGKWEAASVEEVGLAWPLEKSVVVGLILLSKPAPVVGPLPDAGGRASPLPCVCLQVPR